MIASDAGVGLNRTMIRFDGGAGWSNWTEYSGPFNLSIFGNGSFVHIEAFTIDELEHQSILINETFEIDDTYNAPTSALLEINHSYVDSMGATWVTDGSQFNFSLDNATGLQYRIWDGSWTSWAGVLDNFTLNASQNGLIYIEWQAVNGTLNEPVHNISLYFDDIEPAILLHIVQREGVLAA